MRTIKFRGKSSLKGFHPWVYGFLFINDDEQTFIFSSVDDNAINQCPVYEETIGQFTGLTDKNGKEIYEGDIVRILYTDWPSKSESDTRSIDEYLKDMSKVGKVTFSNTGWVVDIYSSKYDEWIESSIVPGRFGFIEIIGNIHDNPNLLTQ